MESFDDLLIASYLDAEDEEQHPDKHCDNPVYFL